MGVKLSQLKLNRLRKEIHFFEGDNMETIQVFNPIGTEKEALMIKFEETSKGNIDETSEQEEQGRVLMDMYIHLLKTLTDIEIDSEEDVHTILTSPNSALILVQHEIHEILNELQIEYWMTKHAELNQSYQAIMMQEAINKADHIKLFMDDVETDKDEMGI